MAEPDDDISHTAFENVMVNLRLDAFAPFVLRDMIGFWTPLNPARFGQNWRTGLRTRETCDLVGSGYLAFELLSPFERFACLLIQRSSLFHARIDSALGSTLRLLFGQLPAPEGRLRFAGARPAVYGSYVVSAEALRQLDFDRRGLATMAVREKGYAYVRRNGRALVVPTLDNYPDEFSSGLVRVRIGEKLGFANGSLKVVIPAT